MDAESACEEELVSTWRNQCLLKAGYPPLAAAELADRPDIDLHAACELVTIGGCDPLTAVDILL